MTQAYLAAGLIHSESLTVAERHTVPHVATDWPGFTDMPPVLATAMMIGFVEQTCIQALRPYLAPGQHTVGTHVDISHVAATPVGMTITATIELLKVNGRMLEFRVSCHDEAGLIGEGNHQRAIIGVERFLQKLVHKAER